MTPPSMNMQRATPQWPGDYTTNFIRLQQELALSLPQHRSAASALGSHSISPLDSGQVGPHHQHHGGKKW